MTWDFRPPIRNFYTFLEIGLMTGLILLVWIVIRLGARRGWW